MSDIGDMIEDPGRGRPREDAEINRLRAIVARLEDDNLAGAVALAASRVCFPTHRHAIESYRAALIEASKEKK